MRKRVGKYVKYFFSKAQKKRFMKFLLRNDLQMKDFARLCGISPTMLSFIVNGIRPLSDEIKVKFEENGFYIYRKEDF